MHNTAACDFWALIADKNAGKLGDVLLSNVTDSSLKNTIDSLWRPSGEIGNGGTADFVRKQIKYGLAPGQIDYIFK